MIVDGLRWQYTGSFCWKKVDGRIHSLHTIHFSFIINVCYVDTATDGLALSPGVGAGQVKD